jgi:hypothetical protein
MQKHKDIWTIPYTQKWSKLNRLKLTPCLISTYVLTRGLQIVPEISATQVTQRILGTTWLPSVHNVAKLECPNMEVRCRASIRMQDKMTLLDPVQMWLS